MVDDQDAGRLASERTLAVAFRAARIGVWDWDLRDNSFVYSDLAKAIYGLPLDRPVTYEDVRDVTHPDDYPWTSAKGQREIDPNIREHGPYRYRILRADTGEERWVLAHGEATFEVVDGLERATHYTGTVQDITEQKHAEDALADSEARLRLAVEAGKMAVWEIDLEKQELTPSPELNVLCGFPPDARPTLEELRARYAPGERERLDREGQEMLARGDNFLQSELRLILPGGTEKWLLLRAAIAPTAGGPGQRVIGVLMDITDRRAVEERVRTVAAELQHRLKNSLAIVQTIASQTLAGHTPPAAVESFLGRVRALAAASDLAIDENWSHASLNEVVKEITRPFRDPSADRFVVSGADLPLPTRTAIGVGMALHELCTNAAKYGALSRPGGSVSLDWNVLEGGMLRLAWRETGGPAVTRPSRSGFGTRLLERGIFNEPDGRIKVAFDPEGVSAQIETRI